MFQRHSALGSEVLQYGLPYFSNFVNTESARQYIAIFLKACWLVWFYLFSFSCSPAVVSYSEAVRQLSASRSQRSEEPSTGLVSLHPAMKQLQHSGSAQSSALGATSRNLLWIQAADCSRLTKTGKSQRATSLPSLPTHRWIPNVIKGCSTVIITLWFFILPELRETNFKQRISHLFR